MPLREGVRARVQSNPRDTIRIRDRALLGYWSRIKQVCPYYAPSLEHWNSSAWSCTYVNNSGFSCSGSASSFSAVSGVLISISIIYIFINPHLSFVKCMACRGNGDLPPILDPMADPPGMAWGRTDIWLFEISPSAKCPGRNKKLSKMEKNCITFSGYCRWCFCCESKCIKCGC